MGKYDIPPLPKTVVRETVAPVAKGLSIPATVCMVPPSLFEGFTIIPPATGEKPAWVAVYPGLWPPMLQSASRRVCKGGMVIVMPSFKENIP